MRCGGRTPRRCSGCEPPPQPLLWRLRTATVPRWRLLLQRQRCRCVEVCGGLEVWVAGWVAGWVCLRGWEAGHYVYVCV